MEEMDFVTDDSEFLLPQSRLDGSDSVLSDADVLTERPTLALCAPDPQTEMVERALQLARALAAQDAENSARPAGELTPAPHGEDQTTLALPSADEGGKGVGRR